MAAADRFTALSGMGAAAGAASFCHLFNTGELNLPAEAGSVIRTITPATLYRWRKALTTRGTATLAGRYGNRRGDTAIQRQPALHTFVTALLSDHPHARATHLLAAVRARFGDDAAVTIPALRSIQRWLARWRAEHRQLHTALADPAAWKNRHLAAFGSASAEITALNQLWEMDSTSADVMLADGRHTLIGVIDVHSRRARLLVSKTSRATAIACLLRRALLEWGVPEQVKTDNGPDYVSHHIRRALAGLGVEHVTCTPGAPWEKPHIERLFRTFSHDLAELLPGYTGHNVTERRAIDSRARGRKRRDTPLTAAELQAFCDRWTDGIYHKTPHAGLNGRTPAQVTEAAPGPVQRITDERALDVLLAEAPGDGIRTVTKQGIRIDGMTYIHAELALHIGTPVRCLYDPHDVGRIVVLGTDPTAFICVAECPEVTGVSRREIAIAARRKQVQAIQSARRELRAAARKVGTRTIVREILDGRTGAETTAATSPVDTAGGPRDIPAPQAAFPADQRGRYHLWHELDRRARAGGTLTRREHTFWQHHPGSAEFQAEEHLHRAFGLPIPYMERSLG